MANEQQKNGCRYCGASESPCNEEGFVHVISSRKKNISYVELCPKLLQIQKCDGTPPYFFFDEQKNLLRPCPTREVRLKLEKIHSLMHQSNIPPKYRYRRITEFQTEAEDDDISLNLVAAHDNAYHFIAQFSENHDEKFRGLYFFGNPGSGKTMLACLILNELILQYQVGVKYIKITRDFFNRIRATFNVESSDYGRGDSFFNAVANVDVLVIDDFGVQADSDWEQRTLYDLIDARYEYERPTIITSNIAPQDLESTFKNRIFSRLKEMTDFQQMIGFDYRDSFQPEYS